MVMKKIAILLAATMAFAINSNAQSMQSGYKGHVEAVSGGGNSADGR